MREMTPEETRDSVVKSLRLALHGPEAVEHETWPGFEGTVVEINEGESFPDELTVGSVPMKDSANRELLAYSPTILYGVGVLYPGLGENELSSLIKNQSELDSDSNLPAESLETVDIQPTAGDETDQEPGESSDPEPSKPKRQRSLAVSCNLGADVAEVTLTVEGSTYERIGVVEKGAKRDLFARNRVTYSQKFSTSRSSFIEFELNSVRLRLGLLLREKSGANRIVTTYVVNITQQIGDVSEAALFQAGIHLDSSSLLPYPRPTRGPDSEDDSLELLYSDVKVYAVGHGCDSVAEQIDNGWRVRSEVMPVVTIQSPSPDIYDSSGQSYEVGMVDLGLFNRVAQGAIEKIINDYASWRQNLGLDSDAAKSSVGKRHLENIDIFHQQIVEGWELVKVNGEVRKVLRWVSLAMNSQRKSSSYPRTRKGKFLPETGLTEGFDYPFPQTTPDYDPGSQTAGFGPVSLESQEKWRPFQIAFLLAELPRILSGDAVERERVDVIWMPTGGGKTEAYLGLAAFVMLFERLRAVSSGKRERPRVTVMMRYTLTLLTSQQVIRAAALMCALEILRVTNTELGKNPFRIGAWLGAGSSPNTWKDARARLEDIGRLGSRSRYSFLLQKCPWCSAEMGVPDTRSKKVSGYELRNFRKRDDRYVAIYCPDADCPFSRTSSGSGSHDRLPVLDTDQDIYAAPPDFIVGTIDKFARLAALSEARSLFGIGSGSAGPERVVTPPSLFIQDELHLIAGPIGSLNALYEFSIDELCRFDGGRAPVIIGATATTKNFKSQITNLYGRTASQLLPPPGFSIKDSFFARTPEEGELAPGKTFVAVCASGLGSVVESQLRVVAALAHAGSAVEQEGSKHSDGWWTNLLFFNSKRSIGLLSSTIATYLGRRIHTYARLSGIRTGLVSDSPEKPRGPARRVREMPELTASSRDNSNQVMSNLSRSREEVGTVDICFATSMIEVGVDIPRLGLMTVMGHPKSESQYIQVTGRVGRSNTAPGLVVVVLSPYNVRDRSNFESFTLNHQKLYASVEPVSLTPFTSQALERGLAGAMSSVLRNISEIHPHEFLKGETGTELIARFRERAIRVSGERGAQLFEAQIEDLMRKASIHERETNEQWTSKDNGLLANSDATHSVEETLRKWLVPNSMRSVEGQSAVKLARRSSNSDTRSAPSNGPIDISEEYEDLFS
jgi:hypothetical protein